jgi:hypothetical protein
MMAIDSNMFLPGIRVTTLRGRRDLVKHVGLNVTCGFKPRRYKDAFENYSMAFVDIQVSVHAPLASLLAVAFSISCAVGGTSFLS